MRRSDKTQYPLTYGLEGELVIAAETTGLDPDDAQPGSNMHIARRLVVLFGEVEHTEELPKSVTLAQYRHVMHDLVLQLLYSGEEDEIERRLSTEDNIQAAERLDSEIGGTTQEWKICGDCNGSGSRYGARCGYCSGRGEILCLEEAPPEPDPDRERD